MYYPHTPSAERITKIVDRHNRLDDYTTRIFASIEKRRAELIGLKAVRVDKKTTAKLDKISEAINAEVTAEGCKFYFTPSQYSNSVEIRLTLYLDGQYDREQFSSVIKTNEEGGIIELAELGSPRSHQPRVYDPEDVADKIRRLNELQEEANAIEQKINAVKNLIPRELFN